MDSDKLKIDLETLHNYKLRIGTMTYGDSSRGKYAMNNLTRKIKELLSFLQNMVLPDDLVECRNKVRTLIEAASVAIDREYTDEVINAEIGRQSELIRQALGKFDGIASKWLETHQID